MSYLDEHPDTGIAPDRRGRILDAAERCFVRAGFHRTTMQDVAREAGMSPGNLYRYFPSKDAIVAGLAERDRAEFGRDFEAFDDPARFWGVFTALGRKHFEERPREKAVMCLEIWAEATRNAAVARVNREFEEDVVTRIARLLEKARARNEIAPAVDPKTAALVIITLGHGLFVRRALAPDFDAEREVGPILALIEGMLSGAIDLAPPREATP